MSKLTIMETIKTILVAFIGVQSNKNRQLDFEKGSIVTYIIAGLIFTGLFVGALAFLVSKVLG